MSDRHSIEPSQVIDLVDAYIDCELADVERYSNRSVFDTSGVWSLHQLARDIYALGVQDGGAQERLRAVNDRARRATSSIKTNEE